MLVGECCFSLCVKSLPLMADSQPRAVVYHTAMSISTAVTTVNYDSTRVALGICLNSEKKEKFICEKVIKDVFSSKKALLYVDVSSSHVAKFHVTL